MAVALATLPLNRLLAGAGDTFLVAGTGAGAAFASGLAAGLATTLAGLLAVLLTDVAAGFAACFAGGFAGIAAFLDTGFATGLAATFLAAEGLTLPCVAAAFFGADFTTTGFLTAGFLTADLTALAAIFLVAVFPVADFLAEAGFFGNGLATALPAVGRGAAFLAATGLAATFFVAALATGLLTVFFAGVLALFTVRPFVAAVFDLPTPASRALAGVFPFCALAAVELRVVFAISLHRFWPWRPGVIADVFYTSKPASGILVSLHAASRFGNVNLPTRLILWLIGLYKRWLSPLLGPRCRFQPTCSDYARIAVTRFGPWRGSLLAGWRLLRCQPLCTGGDDPVPDHFHYPRCRCGEDSADAS